MSSQYHLKITPEQAQEMPMVDLAFLILKAANTPFYYRDIMQEVAKIKGIPDEEVMNVIAQLYTEINIDGRFACVGNNLWGLKRWYPIEKAEDAMNASRPRIINDDDEDDFDEEEDQDYNDDSDMEGYEESDDDDAFVDVDDDDVDEELEELDDEEMMDDEDDEDDFDEDADSELD